MKKSKRNTFYSGSKEDLSSKKSHEIHNNRKFYDTDKETLSNINLPENIQNKKNLNLSKNDN